MSGEALSEELRAGRRELDGMPGVGLIEDYRRFEGSNLWWLHCRLIPDVDPTGPIPAATEWYVSVDPDYPWGAIVFRPAKENGLTQTFPHQEYNGPGPDAMPWRDGSLCLDSTTRLLGRHGHDPEPGDPECRLAWRFGRALRWLELASRGDLLARGHPFELPSFPLPPASTPEAAAFSEGGDSYNVWQGIQEDSGLTEYMALSGRPVVWVTRSFLSKHKRKIRVTAWGGAICDLRDPLRGIWIRLRAVPRVGPWQAPATWGELRQACRAQDRDLYDLVEPATRYIRDGKSHLALLGFPIPRNMGEDPCRMHWQALRLPVLSHGEQTIDGFRPLPDGHRLRDRQKVLRDSEPLQWLPSENWHPDQIATRGSLPGSLTREQVLLVGAGAVGSVVAELLIRAGVQAMLVMDGDLLRAGNLVRHTLGLHDLYQPKASALAQRLNLASPNVTVAAIGGRFPPADAPDWDRVRRSGIIVDCTADDQVLHHMATGDWGGDRQFVSLSLGLHANRLFAFHAAGRSFPYRAFHDALGPWLQQEAEGYSGEDLPWEGIGCWHPVFPARADDVWLMAALAVKWMAAKSGEREAGPELAVFGQEVGQDGSPIVRRVRLRDGHG